MAQVVGIKNTRSLREKMLAGRAKKNETLIPFRLEDASSEAGEDVVVKLRRFELGERAVYFGAPASMSNRIAERTKDYAQIMARNDMDLESGGTMPLVAFMLKMSQEPEFEEIANTVCLAAFVDPPLVETEEELDTNPDAWMVSDLTLADRLSVFYRLQNKEGQGNGNVALREFRPETGSDVEDLAAKPATKTTKRSRKSA